MVSGGIACTTVKVANSSGYTYLNPYNTIDVNGTITNWCFRSGLGGAYVKLKIFRINGSNYDYVGESNQFLVSSNDTVYTSSCNISVLAGDLVGLEIDAGNNCGGLCSSGERSKYHSGDVTSNTPQSEWTTLDTDWKIIVHVGIQDVYVDINKTDDSLDGSSWANAKKTMNAGYSILPAGETMHVASGDYSTQTTIAYNKSWKLSPEDPNATGAKNVKIPKST